MKKVNLAKKICDWLEEIGYRAVLIEGMHSSIDILAQGKNNTLAIKSIYNIDSINAQTIDDLNKIAALFGAEPMVIGVLSNNGLMGKDMVYERFGVKCFSYDAFKLALSGAYPVIASKSVGAKISIDGTKLKYLRKLNNLTAAKLATMLGVSKDTIYHHEKSGGYLAKKTVEKAENIFGERFRFEESTILKYNVKYNAFTGIKMHSARVISAPFNIIAKKNNIYEISELHANSRTLAKRAEILKDFANTFQGNYPFFIGKSNSKSLHGLSIISRKRLELIESEGELLDSILEEANF